MPRSEKLAITASPLSLEKGRQLYNAFLSRPRVAGGVRPSTYKRYRTVFDKFLAYALSHGITTWNSVTADQLTSYAGDLEGRGYAHKTLTNELTTLKETVKWMIQQGHLPGKEPIELKLHKAESESAYCYKQEEISAMVQYCQVDPKRRWHEEIITALACTGLQYPNLLHSVGRISIRDADAPADR